MQGDKDEVDGERGGQVKCRKEERHKTHDDSMVTPSLLDCRHLPSYPVDCLQRKAVQTPCHHGGPLVCLKWERVPKQGPVSLATETRRLHSPPTLRLGSLAAPITALHRAPRNCFAASAPLLVMLPRSDAGPAGAREEAGGEEIAAVTAPFFDDMTSTPKRSKCAPSDR